MPNRPTSHVVSDLAINQVEALFLSQGWAVERIQRDYGEDLLVQTAHIRLVDPFKILVQVKGSKAAPRKSFTIDSAHLWRWKNNSELVLLVLWNVVQGKGLYAIPERVQINPKTGEGRIDFSKASELTSETCALIEWQARIRHWGRIIAVLENRMDLVDGATESTSDYWRAAYEFCNILGLMQFSGDGSPMILSDLARSMAYRVYRTERRDGHTHEAARMKTAFLVFMFMYVKVTKLDVDISLVRSGASVVNAMIGRDARLMSFETFDADAVLESLAEF